jgi:glycerol-3-phosphate dehydrogenase
LIGTHNDSRMNIAIALTAIDKGAVVANYVEVIDLLKKDVDGTSKICGAQVRDGLTGETWKIHAKVDHHY